MSNNNIYKSKYHGEEIDAILEYTQNRLTSVLDEQIQKHTDDISTLNKSFKEEKENTSASFEEVNGEINSLNADVKGLKTKTDASNEEIDTLKERADGFDGAIADLNSSADDLNNRIDTTEDEFNSKIENTNNEIISLNEKVDAEIKRVDEELPKKANVTYVDEEINKKKIEITKTANNTFANVLKGKVSGAVVSVDDVSPIEHNLTVKVRSKNLIAYPYKYNTLTTGGVAYAVGEDGGVTANGTASASFYPIEGGWGNTDTFIPDWLEVGKTYTITDAILLLTNMLEGKTQLVLSGTFVMPEGYRTYGIFINPKDGEVLENKVYYPQLEEGAVATEYKPYVKPQCASLVRCGKNLIAYPYKYKSLTTGGVTFTVDEDGSITANGIASGVWFALHGGWDADTSLPIPSSFKVGKTYTITDGFALMFYDETKTLLQLYVSKTFVMPEGYSHYAVFFNPKDDTVYENRRLYPQLEEGSTATSWESPKEYKTYIPNQDGSVEGITSLSPNMTLMTDTEGVTIETEYNKDTNKVIEELTNAIISLGGNI